MEPIRCANIKTPKIGKILIFEANPNPINIPAIMESFKAPFFVTRCRKNRVQMAKRVTKVSKAKKFES